MRIESKVKGCKELLKKSACSRNDSPSIVKLHGQRKPTETCCEERTHTSKCYVMQLAFMDPLPTLIGKISATERS